MCRVGEDRQSKHEGLMTVKQNSDGLCVCMMVLRFVSDDDDDDDGWPY